MSSSASVTNLKLCICCLSSKNLRSFERPYPYHGKIEFYRKMLTLCFAMQVPSGDNWICSSCVNSLRASVNFRQCIVSAKNYFDKQSNVEKTANVSQMNNTSSVNVNTLQNNEIVLHELPTYPQIIGNELSCNGSTPKILENLPIHSSYNNEEVKKSINVNKSTYNNKYVCDERRIDAQRIGTDERDNYLEKSYTNDQQFYKSIPELTQLLNSDESLMSQSRIPMHFDDINNKTKNPAPVSESAIVKNDRIIESVVDGSKTECNDSIFKMNESDSSSEDGDSFFEYLDDPTPITGDTEHSIGEQKTLPYSLKSTERVCRECNKEFSFFNDLLQHMHEHYPNHICDVCGKVWATRKSLLYHGKIHTDVRYSCEFCSKSFKSRANLNIHVKVRHKGEKIHFKCYVCKENFNTYNDRLKHLTEKHGREDKMYKCLQCPCKYRLGSHLRSHVRRVHLQEKNHKCTECGEAFFRKNTLDAHLSKHEGEMNGHYCCNICSKTYRRNDTLKHHMKCHEIDEQNYLVIPV